MNYKDRKGLTLIEVIVTLALVGLIILPIFSLFNVGMKSHTSIANDYDIQSSARLASQKISEFIKRSNAVFLHKNIEDIFTSDIYTDGVVTINKAFIDASPNKIEFEIAIEKYKGWNFIVMSSDGKELREFTYHQDSLADIEYFEMNRIMDISNDESITFDIQYKMNNSYDKDKLLEFLIIGNRIVNGSELIKIESEVESLNSLQVVDRGSHASPARVLFYRSDERPIGYDAKATVAMVLDVSGSMGYNMGGKKGEPTRISILQEKSKSLLNSMGDLDVDITMVPFSNFAYNEWEVGGNLNDLNKFYNIKTEKTELDGIINSLKTVGGTNVGDGIRRAYYRLSDYNDILNDEDDGSIENKDATKYMILLMDGVPTFGSVYRTNIKNNKYTNIDFVISDEEIEDIRYSSSTWNYEKDRYNDIYSRYMEYDKYYERLSGYNNVLVKTETKTTKSLGFYSGNGNTSDDYLSMGYIGEVSKLLENIKNIDGNKNLKVYVIGFSNNGGDTDKIDTIKGLISPHVQMVTSFKATSDDELEKVFDGIRQTILEDFWHIYGPKEY